MESDLDAKIKILRQLGKSFRAHKQGFDFTIATSRVEWFEEILDTLKLAHLEIAISRAALRRTKFVWWRRLVAYVRNHPSPDLFEVACVGQIDGLVLEDFTQDGKPVDNKSVRITCISIALTQELLDLRESTR